jgi:hypothetical protein
MTISCHPDPIDAVVAAIRAACDATPDPYLLAGVLLAGVVRVISEHLAAERPAESGLAAVRLMLDRLHAARAI